MLDFMLAHDKNNKFATRSDLTDGYRFIAGAIAGCVAATITYPLGVLRTHVSVNLESNKIEIDLLKWNKLFRGLSPTLIAMSTMAEYKI